MDELYSNFFSKHINEGVFKNTLDEKKAINSLSFDEKQEDKKTHLVAIASFRSSLPQRCLTSSQRSVFLSNVQLFDKKNAHPSACSSMKGALLEKLHYSIAFFFPFFDSFF